jgi:hypothetical protein
VVLKLDTICRRLRVERSDEKAHYYRGWGRSFDWRNNGQSPDNSS